VQVQRLVDRGDETAVLDVMNQSDGVLVFKFLQVRGDSRIRTCIVDYNDFVACFLSTAKKAV
jgi:hypothetical protein